jgi:hypothetical protein
MLKPHNPAMAWPESALFWLLLALLGWCAHTVGYLVHEYAHSFSAWTLGWKANPLALELRSSDPAERAVPPRRGRERGL